jgi:hypothetical protein
MFLSDAAQLLILKMVRNSPIQETPLKSLMATTMALTEKMIGNLSMDEIRAALLNLEGIQVEEQEVLFMVMILWAAMKRQGGRGRNSFFVYCSTNEA